MKTLKQCKKELELINRSYYWNNYIFVIIFILMIILSLCSMVITPLFYLILIGFFISAYIKIKSDDLTNIKLEKLNREIKKNIIKNNKIYISLKKKIQDSKDIGD